MDRIVLYLDNHSTFFQLIITFVIGLTSIVSAVIAAMLFRENWIIRKAGTEPRLVAFLEPDSKQPSLVYLTIANVGRGSAVNVSYDIEIKPAELVDRNHSFPTPLRGREIPALIQDGRWSTFIGVGPQLLKSPPLKPFDVLLRYKNTMGKHRSETFKLDVATLAGEIHIPPMHDEQVLRNLESMAKSLERLKRG